MRKLHPIKSAYLVVIAFAAIVVVPDPAYAAEPEEVRIVLAGDSTVTDKAGWGGTIGGFFEPNVKVINLAAGGRSSKSFINEGRLKKAIAARPDYLFIQFGHNDCPGKGPKRYTDPAGSYMDYLKVYIKEARKAGAKPILVTPMTRRHFDEQGKIKSILTPYAKAVRRVGKEENVPVIDLYTGSVELFEHLGESKSSELQPKGDRTHFNEKGAKAMSKIITDGLKQADPELAKWLKEDRE